MKMIRQMLRQPLKTVIGIALMTLAATIGCLCVGQALAARTTKEALNQRFSTVGIPLVQGDIEGNVALGSFLLEQELDAWMGKMTAEHPDVIKQVARHGILSAHIPEMIPLNTTQELYVSAQNDWYSYQASNTMPYTCAMLVITLDTVSAPEQVIDKYPVENLSQDDFETYEEYFEWLHLNPETEKMSASRGYRIELTGTVTGVISLAEGYRNPVGRVARLTFSAPTLEEIQSLNLEPGQQYIVYGMDYTDEHWKLMGINIDGRFDYLNLESYDPELFRYLAEWEKQHMNEKAEAFPELNHLKNVVGYYGDRTGGVYLTEPQCLQLNAISMTLDTPVSLIRYEEIRDEWTGELKELRPETQITYTDANGEVIVCSFEEYRRRYPIPTIARLDGSVEVFLNSREGVLWKKALQWSAINNQAFAVIGTDKMNYLADFSLQRSRIVEGRDFTEEEQKGGSLVCIIHESLAQANGLQIGDTITLNLYTTDWGLPYQQFRTDGKGILSPSASFYFDTTPIVETAEYTVVGFWRGENLWPDVAGASEYAFSPNTVFVPQASVQMPMEKCSSLVFNTLVLQNGKIEEFHDLAMNSGYAGRFKYNDQGYATIAANFHNYDSLAKQMLIVGVVLYTVLLLLFLWLYPGAQKGNAWTMQSLGGGFARRLSCVMVSSLAIVIAASLLGNWISSLLWYYMVAALQNAAESAVALQIEPGALAVVSSAQLVLAAVLTVAVAVFVALPRSISARR